MPCHSLFEKQIKKQANSKKSKEQKSSRITETEMGGARTKIKMKVYKHKTNKMKKLPRNQLKTKSAKNTVLSYYVDYLLLDM